MYVLPISDGARKKVLKIILCRQLTSRCVSVSKICCTNFNSHEWLFHLNVAGGDNVRLVIQTGVMSTKMTHSCKGGFKGAVRHFFMEWRAENDPNPRNVSPEMSCDLCDSLMYASSKINSELHPRTRIRFFCLVNQNVFEVLSACQTFFSFTAGSPVLGKGKP